jgi:endonuclease III-like uncharacterized protein
MNLLKEIQINKNKINELTKEEFEECIKTTKEYYYNKKSIGGNTIRKLVSLIEKHHEFLSLVKKHGEGIIEYKDLTF